MSDLHQTQQSVPLQDYLDMVEMKEEMHTYYTKTLNKMQLENSRLKDEIIQLRHQQCIALQDNQKPHGNYTE